MSRSSTPITDALIKLLGATELDGEPLPPGMTVRDLVVKAAERNQWAKRAVRARNAQADGDIFHPHQKGGLFDELFPKRVEK